jgi:8-oxo-dGTP diphosphatase
LDLAKSVVGIVKEATRHLLRRPVVGVVAVARTKDRKTVLIRRRDTGKWALPGGTVEWGETLQSCIRRELREEAGVEVIHLGPLSGIYSHPDRDWRFHAITIVVEAIVTPPITQPKNSLEIIEVGLFAESELPTPLSHNMDDMLSNTLAAKLTWE